MNVPLSGLNEQQQSKTHKHKHKHLVCKLNITSMLPLKHVTKHRLKSLFTSIPTLSNNNLFLPPFHNSCYASLAISPKKSPPSFTFPQNDDVTSTFKTWFASRYNSEDLLLRRIYQILASGDHFSPALSALNLPLDQTFVLRVLRYGSGNGDILSCLKFFDWAGRQPYYNHSRAAYVTIFRILTRAKLMPLVLDFLQAFRKRVYEPSVRFHDTLVIGYAIAGKPDIALQVLGKMRYKGLDLDGFAYHVLLNALAEENYLNAFDVIVNQIRIRGYENSVTNAIVVKSLCKQGRLEEADDYVNDLFASGKELQGTEVGLLINALCMRKGFERAFELIKKFGDSGLVPLEYAYSVCVKGLVRRGRLDEALEFFLQKKDSEDYVPDTARYNTLICKLLRHNRLHEVYDLLMDMNNSCIPPDVVTMNVVMCFFCKVGMVDVALDLYNSRSEFGLSPNQLAYKYLILTLCWDGSVKEAYSVLKNSLGRGFFADKQTFATLANALCRECMIDEMKELIRLALERKITPSRSTYEKFTLAMCRAKRVEDGYLMHGELDSITALRSYRRMIIGLIKSQRGDIAARLLVEMKEKGHELSRELCRVVIRCLLEMDNPRTRVINLLDMLTHGKPHLPIFNCFIDGAGHAKKTELAKEVFDLMLRNNIEPNSSSKILMLNCYLKSGRFTDAWNFFRSLRCPDGTISKRLYNSMVVGLSKSNKPDMAQKFLFEMLSGGLNPSIDSYEYTVQKLCSLKKYHEAINLVYLYMRMGRRLTSFLGNVLLYHSLTTRKVYDTCVRSRGAEEGECSGISILIFIIGAFSGRLRVNHSIKELEELLAICFPPDIYTYNLLLTKATQFDMGQACALFHRICQKGKGYEPNAWSYDIMVVGFLNHGRKDDAKHWFDEMNRKGFHPKDDTKSMFQKAYYVTENQLTC